MAFFKLSDLSEKEKKKYLQSIEDQVIERLNSRNSLEKEANDNFNNIFNSKYGQNNNINVGNTNDWATSKIKEKNSANNLLAPEEKIELQEQKNGIENVKRRNNGRIKRKKYSQATRKLIYNKYDGRCQLCGRKILFSEMSLDHHIALSMGGVDDVSNLECTCLPCNQFKSNIAPEFNFLFWC